MNAVLLIARRELSAYLRTLSGYVILAVVLFVDGLFFNAYAVSSSPRTSGQILGDFFFFSSGLTMVCAVFLSMRLIAEDRQLGTMALLLSSPVRDRHIVLGKYLSALAFLALFLAATFYMPLLVMWSGKVSWGHIAAGYFGLLLVGSASVALGTLGSALARNQVIAAVSSGVMLIGLSVCWLLTRITEAPLSDVVLSLGWYTHFKPFQDGLVQLKHVVYFVLLTWVALFGATRILEARRWR